MDSYIFNGNTDTPESVARRRQVADALAAKIFGQAPQNLGSGIAAIGQALIARQMGQESDAAEAAGRQNANAAFAPIIGGGTTPTDISNPATSRSMDIRPTTLVPNDSNAIPGTVSMDQRLADQTQDFIQDNPGTYLSSGVRTTGDQARLYADRANNPNPVAPPGTSLHERGMAADIGGMTPAQRAMLPQYGLSQPVANDPPHVQLAYGDQPYQVAGPAVAAPGAIAPTASPSDTAIPPHAQPARGFSIPGQSFASAPVAGRPTMQQLAAAISNPWLSKGQQAVAQALYEQRLKEGSHTQETDSSGNIWDVNRDTGQRTVALKKVPSFGAPYKDSDGNLVQRDATGRITVLNQADKAPTSVSEYKFYRDNLPQGQEAMDYATWSTAKARAGATNISNNIDMNTSATYKKQLAEGLGKSHASLANGGEDAQSRARDVAAMQGAIDQIQKNGGTTGGMGQAQMLELKKAITSGAAALGINNPFNENDISDKEFLTKFNRQMAGAQAKGAVGSRVTNFEMSNYLKANPGLDMSVIGNQRLLGIQAQIEQRNIAVGNAIREATAAAISKGQKIDPVTVQKIITQYDDAHHVQDPISGQDLTQSYVLPEFQQQGQGTNSQLEVGKEANIAGIKI